MRILFLLFFYFYSLLLYADENFKIQLNKPTNEIKLTLLPGPIHRDWPDYPCLMCLGNFLIQHYNIEGTYVSPNLSTSGYLAKIGYSQWPILYNNLKNDPNFLQSQAQKEQEAVSLFAPTPVEIIEQIFKIIKLKPSDILYDLGCGDGRVAILASGLYNCKSVGVDLDQDCVKNAQKNVKLNNLENLVQIKHADILKTNFNNATVVYTYLMPNLTYKLLPQFSNLSSGTRIIAYDKPIIDLPLYKSINLTSLDNVEHTIYLYIITTPISTKKFL
jgi:hypothetical protein